MQFIVKLVKFIKLEMYSFQKRIKHFLQDKSFLIYRQKCPDNVQKHYNHLAENWSSEKLAGRGGLTHDIFNFFYIFLFIKFTQMYSVGSKPYHITITIKKSLKQLKKIRDEKIYKFKLKNLYFLFIK